MASEDRAVVVDGRGRTHSLGAFLQELVERSGQSVVDVVERAHVSRSFFYLLRDDKQVPSVDSLVGLLEALDVDDVRAAAPGEPGEIAVTVDGRDRWVRLPPANRRAARSRAALHSLATPSQPLGAPPVLAGPPPDAPPPVPAAPEPVPPAAPAAAAASPVGAASFAVVGGRPRPAPPDNRTRLLRDLLRHAETLDDARLRLLVEHARLLARG